MRLFKKGINVDELYESRKNLPLFEKVKTHFSTYEGMESSSSEFGGWREVKDIMKEIEQILNGDK